MSKFISFRKNLSRSPSGSARRRARPHVEQLETRDMLSVFTPGQIRQAYRINQVPYNGAGQTIAIVDGFNAPTIASDLAWFDTVYGLPWANLQVVNQTGGSWLPAFNRGWSDEISADVEWAHAVAPGAKILLVEANSNYFSDLLTAVDYASAHANIVSMSWGSAEFPAETGWWYDGHFANHPGVTFLTSAGDLGAPAGWPGVSPNVISVGGTSLTTLWDGTYVSETGWSGSGGGISLNEPKPSYQWPVWQSWTQRTNPDVAFVADPKTGVSIYNSSSWGWEYFGGTSLGAPAWAGLIALADQGRAANGQSTLSSAQALSSLYSTPWNFHDIVTGNNGYWAGWGYDLVTGLGTPVADLVVNSLVGASASAAGLSATSFGLATTSSAAPNFRVTGRAIVRPDAPANALSANDVLSSLTPAWPGPRQGDPGSFGVATRSASASLSANEARPLSRLDSPAGSPAESITALSGGEWPDWEMPQGLVENLALWSSQTEQASLVDVWSNGE
jgi:subtilase family serine protease